MKLSWPTSPGSGTYWNDPSTCRVTVPEAGCWPTWRLVRSGHDVVAEHTRCGHGQGRVDGCRVGVVDGDASRLVDDDRHHGAAHQRLVGVADLVGELVDAPEPGVRCVVERAVDTGRDGSIRGWRSDVR